MADRLLVPPRKLSEKQKECIEKQKLTWHIDKPHEDTPKSMGERFAREVSRSCRAWKTVKK